MDRLIVSVSGVRGIVGEGLTAQVGYDFGCAFGTMLGPGKTVATGRDTRPSGATIRDAVVSGLLATGVNAVDLGVVTTPGVALMTRKLHADGGIIITASHNPSQYNGIKFLQSSGPALRFAEADKLKQIWASGEYHLVDAPNRGMESHNGDTHSEHVNAVCAVVDAQAIAARKFRVVLDSINGAGCVVTPTLLDRLGCDLTHVNGAPTGDFAHRPEPIAENLTQLGQVVREHGADVGFAQDPDADRLVILDESGNFIGEEYTLALATAFVLRGGKGKVATNMVTSRMIDDVAARAECEVVRAPTGEANVVEAMEKQGCFFGGEGNGGVIDPRVVPVRDSLVAIAYILQYMQQTGKTISQLVSEIPRYAMIKTKLPCPPEAARKVIQATRELFSSRKGARFDDSDGLRVDLTDAWVSVRASNTEPIIRISAEATQQHTAQSLIDELHAIADGIVK